MKKLMVILAVAMAVGATQAASFVWKATGGNIYDGSGKTDTANKYTGTAYFFDAGVMTQAALFEAFTADTSAVASKAIATINVSAGSFVTTGGANQFSYGEEGDSTKYSFYFALVDGDNLYLSNQLSDQSIVAPPTAKGIAFQSQNNGTSTFSSTAAAEGFKGAGYWQTASVPEPTSGLLILLGMAGLALRRKQK